MLLPDSPNPLPALWNACFSSHGRLSAPAFTASAVLTYALFYVGDQVFAPRFLWPYLLAGPATVIVTIALVSVTARRLHDIPLPGWPAAIVALPITFSVVSRLWYPAWLSRNLTAFDQPLTFEALLYAAVFVPILALAFWPGTKGPNRHGPDPRERGDPQDVF